MMANMLPAEVNANEITRAVASRTTKGGRRLHYELICLQQPERARACGSGQKSAADRRPVDPPPVVQLRVLEGPTFDDSKDITLGYNANFFCYVDLQHARPMANGRVQTAAATSPPVLTGAPVSGMAYLDRPAEAGYFLFPDLSVRHEGRYVLGFTLYEELKDEADWDAEPTDDDPTPGFYCRMRVLSNPFIVFSAKKFPGLTSSTSLSRTISEQGCRVRIRRDVRMRRRDGKPSSNNDYDKNPDDQSRSRREATPEIRKEQYRGRSASNSSEQRAAYPTAPAPIPVADNRPLEADTFPPPPPPPAPASHMRYGSDASSHEYGSQPMRPVPPPAPVQQQPPPISPTSSHFSSQPSPYTTAPPPPYAYANRPAPGYGPPPPRNPPSTPIDLYERRSSAATVVPPSPSHSHYAPKDDYRRSSVYPMDSDYPRISESRRDSHHFATTQPSPSGPGDSLKLPPIQDIAAGHSDSNRMPRPSIAGYAPPVYPSASYEPPSSSRGNDFIEPAPPSMPVLEEPVRAGSKRGFGDTFVEDHAALHNGGRPQAVHHAPQGRRSAYDDDPHMLVYMRADGRQQAKTPNAFYVN